MMFLASLFLKIVTTMGKSKKNLEDLKKDLKTIEKKDMKKIVGGKNKNKWNNGSGCSGIIPQ